MVSIIDKPTRLAHKFSLVLSVGFVGMSALAASLAGICRIDNMHRNACKQRLVGDKCPQLEERPTVHTRYVGFPGLHPSSNSFQVLKDDSEKGAFGFFNNLFRYAMVGVSTKIRFFVTDFFQVAFSRFGTAFLQSGSQCLEPFTAIINLLTRKRVSIGSGGNLNNAEIYTKETFGFNRWLFFGFYRNQKVKFIVFVNKVGLAFSLKPSGFLVFAINHWHNLPSFKSPQRNLIDSLKGHYALVVNHSPMLTKRPLNFLVKFIGVNRFANGTDNDLCGKFEILFNIVIHNFMQREFRKAFLLKCNCRNIITGCVKPFHSGKEYSCLFV